LGFWAFVNQLEADQDHLLNETDAGSAAQPASPCPDSHNSIAAHKRSTFTPFGASSAAPSSSLTRPRFLAHRCVHKPSGNFKPSLCFTTPSASTDDLDRPEGSKTISSIEEKSELRQKPIEWNAIRANCDHQRAWKKNQEPWKNQQEEAWRKEQEKPNIDSQEAASHTDEISAEVTSSAAAPSSPTRPRFIAHPKFSGKFKPSKYFTYPTKNSSGELDDAAATDSQC